MTDAEFGRLVGKVAPVSQQAVGMWRRGERMPSPVYIRNIEEATLGAVVESDLRSAWLHGRAKKSNGAD